MTGSAITTARCHRSKIPTGQRWRTSSCTQDPHREILLLKRHAYEAGVSKDEAELEDPIFVVFNSKRLRNEEHHKTDNGIEERSKQYHFPVVDDGLPFAVGVGRIEDHGWEQDLRDDLRERGK